jgi:hypothetical protein
MTRRTSEPLVTLTLTLLWSPLVTEAPPAPRPWRIAFLGAESPGTSQHFLDAFRQGLRDLGYVEGQTLIPDARRRAWRGHIRPMAAPCLARCAAVPTPAGGYGMGAVGSADHP